MSKKTITKPINDVPQFYSEEQRNLANLALFEENVYLCYEKLYKLEIKGLIAKNNITFQWVPAADIPFTQRKGQKMISIPNGIAFFGGEDEDKIIYNDLWIWNGTDWEYLATNIPPLVSPAACYAGDNKILIHGGVLEGNVYNKNTFYFVDLETSATNEISINFPENLHSHTITLLSNGKFILYGGTSADGVSSKLYTIDFETRTYERIESPYDIAVTGHYTSEIYTLLFCVGGYDEGGNPANMWLFNFDHNIWFRYKPDTSFQGVFVYTSSAVNNGVAFHCISRNLDTFLTYSICKTPPKCSIKDTQNFTKFVSNQIKSTIQEFAIPSRKNSIDSKLLEIRDQFHAKAAESGIAPETIMLSKTIFDDLDKLNEVKFRIISLQSNIKLQQSTRQREFKEPSHYDRAKFVELRKFIEKSKNERKTARQQSIELNQQIDRLSFSNYIANIKNRRLMDCTNEEIDRKLAKSQQLAQLISSMREERDTLARHRAEESKTEMENARTEVVLLDQIGASWEEADRLRAASYESKNACLNIIVKLIELRIQILDSLVELNLNQRHEYVAQAETPSKCMSVTKMIQKKRSLVRDVEKQINDLFVRTHKSDSERIQELQNCIEDIGAWASAAKEVCTEVKKPLPQLGNVPREKFALEKLDIFISSLSEYEYDFELKDYTSFIFRQSEK